MPNSTKSIDLNGHQVVISTTQTALGQWSWSYTMDCVTRVGGGSYWTRSRAIKAAVVAAGQTVDAIYGMDDLDTTMVGILV